MAPASSGSSSSATNVRTARLLGVGSTIIVPCSLAFSVLGIADLAHGHFETGLWDLVAVAALRWALGTLLDEWGESAAVRVRALWRHRLVSHLASPRSEGERGRGDLALAIDCTR